MKAWILWAAAGLLAAGCKQGTGVQEGVWRAEIPMSVGVAPFNFSVEKTDKADAYVVKIMNGEERLQMDSSFVKADSLHIPMALYEAEIVAHVAANTLTGYYQRKQSNGKIVRLPFKAIHGQTHRFETPLPPKGNVAGKWKTTFSDENGSSEAVGVFEQKEANVTGTFLTSTGDYRYLQGNLVGDSLLLSCYDGSHLFLFKAKVQGDSLVGGLFGSGATFKQNWVAARNEAAALPDARSLTYLKPGYKTIDFSFKNERGQTVSLKDARYAGKVVVVQIMGSWCPNCMDETRFMVPFYEKYKEKGLEVIGLTFERSSDPAVANKKIDLMKNRFKIPYEVLLAGDTGDNSAEKALPMLNHVMAFPTMLVLNKKGDVHEIHTGFSGPGTGRYYKEFEKEFTATIEKLLAE